MIRSVLEFEIRLFDLWRYINWYLPYDLLYKICEIVSFCLWNAENNNPNNISQDNNQNKVQSIHVNVGAKEDQMTSFQD